MHFHAFSPCLCLFSGPFEARAPAQAAPEVLPDEEDRFRRVERLFQANDVDGSKELDRRDDLLRAFHMLKYAHHLRSEPFSEVSRLNWLQTHLISGFSA